MTFILSNIDGSNRIEYSEFADTLKHDITNFTRPKIHWTDEDNLIALDIDRVPDDLDCECLIRLMQPTPIFAWVTRSTRGLRLIYRTDRGYMAEELAAMAVWWLRDRIQNVHCEFLTHTFHPMDSIVVSSPRTEIPEEMFQRLLSLQNDVSQDEISEFLFERGLVVGRKYSHDNCVIAPSSRGEREPVQINENGIFCHYCAATRGTGFVSYSRLLGIRRETDFGNMIKNKTHWEHARYIMAEITQMPDTVNRRLYSAALIFRHGQSVRNDSIFTAKNCVRINGWWGSETGELYNKEIKNILRSLPVASGDKVISDKLNQTVDLSNIGYPSLEILRGIQIYGKHLEYEDRRYTLIIQTVADEFKPKYLEAESRDIESAWRKLEEAFPNINRAALQLCIAARGISEGRIGLPPFIFMSGPSGAGKTATIKIAAAICGDNYTEVPWTNVTERMRQSLFEGKTKGGFVAFDEIFKNAKKTKTDIITAMNDALSLTPDSVSHHLYVGPVRLGHLPAVFWADTDVPIELKESVQIGRRIIHCRMLERVEWEKSLYESGVSQITRLRIASKEFALACDTILSDCIDRFFTEKKDLKTIADELGYYPLNAAGMESSETLKEFFDIVCQSPNLNESDSRRWRGPGWKLIELSAPNKLSDYWESLQDADNPRTSRRCNEANWPGILKCVGPIEFEIQSHGNKLVVRFVKRINNENLFNLTCLT